MAGNYGYTLTLLVMPEAKRRWRRRDEDEEPVEDSHDRFTRVRRLRSQVFVFDEAYVQKCHYNSANCSGTAGFPIPSA